MLALTLLAGAGCGQGLVPVQGVVTVDGLPVVKAMVRFIPAEGSPRLAFGVTDNNGHFRLTTYEGSDGVLPGVYKVVISSPENTLPGPVDPQNPVKAHAEWVKAMKELKKKPPQRGVLPVLYGDLEATPLHWKVPADGQMAVFELRSGAPLEQGH
jgi:hypothetical protein